MPVLEVSQLEVTRGARAVVQGVSFAVERGESVTIMGASGSGQNERAACDRRSRSHRRGWDRHRRRGDPSRTDAGRSRATRAVSTGWDGVPVSPPVRAPHGASQRLARSGARARISRAKRRSDGRSNFSSRWASVHARTRCLTSYQEVKRSVSRLHVRWRWGRRSC